MFVMGNESNNLNRILMTVDTVGGVWNYAVELIKGLSDRGIEVALATMGPLPDAEKQKSLAGIKNVDLYESSFKLEWMEQPWEDVEEASEWLLELEIMLHPNIVHLNGFVHGALPWHSPVVVVGHSCVSSWYEKVKGEKVPSQWQYYQKRVSEGLRGADAVVAPSKAMLDMLKTHYGISDLCRVIYNGRSRGDEVFAKKNMVLSAGRVWDEGKNMDALMSIASELPWPLFIAGDCANKPVKYEKVKLLRQIPNQSLLGWMRDAAIYALPARYEPFGLSILEAAGNECALVLGDIESLREIWGDAAVYVNPDDREELKTAINRLIENDSLRNQYGKKARQRASQFSSDIMVNNYIDLYNNLICKRFPVSESNPN
jgi:glycosyltransferase involved in cell wall biosynthesis